MTTTATTKRSAPLGSIALTALITALIARKDLRDRLIEQVRDVSGTAAEVAVHTYGDTVKTVTPLAKEAGSLVQEVAQSALQGGGERLGQLREGGASLLHTGLEGAQVVAQQAVSGAQTVAKEAGNIAQSVVARQAAQGAKQAGKAAAGVRRAGKVAAQTRSELKVRRSRLEKAAMREAAKASAKAMKRLAKLEAQLEITEKGARRSSGGSSGSTLFTVALVGVGAYLLARNPRVRQGILDGVRSVSPQAADALHSGGRQVRNIIGSVWLERDEPGAAAAPAAPRGGQGASAYASPSSTSDAGKRAEGEQPQAQATDAQKDKAQANQTQGGTAASGSASGQGAQSKTTPATGTPSGDATKH